MNTSLARICDLSVTPVVVGAFARPFQQPHLLSSQFFRRYEVEQVRDAIQACAGASLSERTMCHGAEFDVGSFQHRMEQACQ